MKIGRGRGLDLVLVALLVGLALVLRLKDFRTIPYPGETADEYAYLWAGWSFLHNGVPTSWSWKDAYPVGEKVFANGTLYRFVTPWLDHPPLFALLVGAAASFGPAKEVSEVGLRAGRAVAVGLGGVTTALLYALARGRYGRGVAALAALFFAVLPTAVVANRLALAETLTTPLTLIGVLAVERGWFALALLASFLAPLAKVPGISVGMSVAAHSQSYPRRAAALAAAIAGLVPYVGYGLLVAPRVFMDVLSDQSGRSSGVEVLAFLLRGEATLPVAWHEAWMPVLLIAAFWQRDRLIGSLLLPYLVVMVASFDQSVPRVWYREPLFPGLCLAGALAVRALWRRPFGLGAGAVVFGLTFGKLGEGPNVWQLIGTVGQRLFPFAALAIGAPMLAGWRRMMRWEVALGVAVAVLASVYQVWNARGLYPEYHPPRYEEVKVGVIQRYRLEEGDPLRATVVWEGGGGRPSTAVLRAGRQVVARGSTQPADGTKEYQVSPPGPGRYELAIDFDGQPLVLGTVTVPG